MAEWKSEKSMLTEKGIEILNKVKVGSGRLTISKIVAGDGSTSVSSLYTSTDVRGNKKQMSLSKVVARVEGSEVSFYVSNEGLTSPFHIRQIGIFVTHPDYEGDILYHISQCEESEHDVIPVSEGNVTNYGYTVYLAHSNQVSITTVVSPTGCIQKVQNAISGTVPVLTPDGDLAGTEFNLDDFVQDYSTSLNSARPIVLVEGLHYGNSLPEEPRPTGSIFFKKVVS